MDNLDNLENYYKKILELENKIKYLQNVIDIIIYDTDIRGNKLTFENTISTTEDILEYVRLKELKKQKLLVYNKMKNINFDDKIKEINKYIDKLINKDQFTINKLLLSNDNKDYFDFIKKHDKEFINKNFDKNNCPIKTLKKN